MWRRFDSSFLPSWSSQSYSCLYPCVKPSVSNCWFVCFFVLTEGTERESPNNVEKPPDRKPPVKKPRLPQNRNMSLDLSGTRLCFYLVMCVCLCVCSRLGYKTQCVLLWRNLINGLMYISSCRELILILINHIYIYLYPYFHFCRQPGLGLWPQRSVMMPGTKWDNNNSPKRCSAGALSWQRWSVSFQRGNKEEGGEEEEKPEPERNCLTDIIKHKSFSSVETLTVRMFIVRLYQLLLSIRFFYSRWCRETETTVDGTTMLRRRSSYKP